MKGLLCNLQATLSLMHTNIQLCGIMSEREEAVRRAIRESSDQCRLVSAHAS